MIYDPANDVDETEDTQRVDRILKASFGVVGLALGVAVLLVGGLTMVGIANSIGVQASAGSGGESPDQLPGATVALDQGCVGCHSIDGSTLAGPTWQGIFETDRTMDTGDVVFADEDYLIRSIVDPAFEIVEGFDAVMPTDYEEKLTEEEINDLVDYIESLA